MRALPIISAVLGAVVIIWEIPYIGSKTGLWPVLMLLAGAIILLAVAQLRHGGSDAIPSSRGEPPRPPVS
jgi:hypothetical protein